MFSVYLTMLICTPAASRVWGTENLFCAAVRLSVAGQTVGTLCVYDTTTRQVSSDQVEALKILGKAAVESLAQRLTQ